MSAPLIFTFVIDISEPKRMLPICLKYVIVYLKLLPVKTKKVITIVYIKFAFMFFRL